MPIPEDNLLVITDDSGLVVIAAMGAQRGCRLSEVYLCLFGSINRNLQHFKVMPSLNAFTRVKTSKAAGGRMAA